MLLLIANDGPLGAEWKRHGIKVSTKKHPPIVARDLFATIYLCFFDKLVRSRDQRKILRMTSMISCK